MATIRIPSKLKARLNKEHTTIIDHNLIDFSHILKEDKLFFFPEYTDHGINHIEGVLKSIEKLISDDTFKKLSSLDICAIIIATVLHDIGMHTSPEMFKNMIMGEYDHIPGNLFIEKTWKELWTEYLKDCRYWNQEKKDNVFGEKDYIIKEPNIDDLQSFNEYDKKFIGEFIRIHHARLAYEIALKGFIGKEKIAFDFSKNHDLNNEKFIQVAGLVARSHGMNIRDTFDYLKPYGKDLWKKPLDIKVIFLMTLIRLADYIQIDASRTDELTLKLRVFYSQYSLREHKTHLAIDYVHFDNDDKEKILVEASPKDAKMYVKIDNLIHNIQKEFDLSWAILGEVYENQYKMRYRRVESNLTDEEVRNGFDFVPNQFGLRFNNKLFELLIAPLYGNNPNYGVRELVQNAVDACRTRLAVDPNYSETISHVRVDLDTEKKLFEIEDSGIGMTIDEIEKFFLTIGSSYDSSIEWQKTRDAEGIYRTGHFGIGILAAFLLGNRITVKTRSIKSKQGYMFTVSLHDSFIQINKIEKQNIGTIITVQCEDNSVEELTKDVLISEIVEKNDESPSDYWFNLYIDEVPRVCYYSDKVQITPHLNASRGFMKLNYQHDEFEVFWKPLPFYWDKGQNEIDKSPLYCNGFFITDSPSKGSFNLNFSSYLHKIHIPALIIKDKYNMLPLNLKRDNIDSNYTYSFEKELAYELFKDLICRLCAINVEDFNRNYLCFTANGFAINQYPSFPFIDNNSASLIKKDLYTENFLSNKKIVNIICTEKDAINKININEFRKIIKGFPEYVFYFYEDRNIFNNHNTVVKYHINEWLFWQFNCIVVDKSHSKHLSFQRFVPPYRPNDNIRLLNDYVFFNLQEEYSDLLASIRILFNNCNLSSPPYFLIKKNKKSFNPSEVDDFFNKYASGDLIIPYDEADRKIKFAKIYEECGEKIERYREAYKRHRKEGI